MITLFVESESEGHDHDVPQPDTPKREWITKISSHDVRIDDPGSKFPSLALYYRCEWCDPTDNICGRTWENEYVFGDGSEMLLDYCKRHHKSIYATIARARAHNPDLDMNMMPTKYLTMAMAQVNKDKQIKASRTPASQSTNVEDDDNEDLDDDCRSQPASQCSNGRSQEELEQMFKDAGGIMSPKPSKQRRNTKRQAQPDEDEAPPMRAQAMGSVNIKCGDVIQKFDVDEGGKLLKDVQELGQDMGIVGNADMLLFTGRYMADREDDHFVVSQDILNAECTLTLTGQAIEDSPIPPNQPADVPKASYTAPYPDGMKNNFMLPHREVHTKSVSLIL